MPRQAVLIGNTASYSQGANIASKQLVARTFKRISSLLTALPSRYSFRVSTLIDQTPGDVRRRLDEIAERAASTDSLLLLYYFGHGLLSSSLELTLVHPSSAADAPATLRLGAIEAVISAAGLQKSIFILDCCYAGAQERTFPTTLAGQHCRLASTTPSARAYLATGSLQDPIGVFTRALLDGLTSQEACRSATDNSITAESLFKYAEAATTRLTSGIQHPVMLGNLTEPLTEYRRIPNIVPGLSRWADEKTAYRKILAIAQTIRTRQPMPDVGALYDAVLDEYPEPFQTLHKNSDGTYQYLPVQEQVISRYVRLLRVLGFVDPDQIILTKAGIGLVANSASSYNERLLQAIDQYLASLRLSRERLDEALQGVLASRRVTTADEVLDYLILGGHRFSKRDLAVVLDLLGYTGAIRMSPSRAYFPW